MFSINANVAHQMEIFSALRVNDPEMAKLLFETGVKLVTYAENGQLRKFKTEALKLESKSELLSYFVPQMIRGALSNGHLMLASFILDNGFQISHPVLGAPNCIHEVFSIVDDCRANSILEFLLNKGLDINMQVRFSYCFVIRFTDKLT